jgi:hypothetical protein
VNAIIKANNIIFKYFIIVVLKINDIIIDDDPCHDRGYYHDACDVACIGQNNLKWLMQISTAQ